MDDSKNKNLQWKKTCDQLKNAFDAWDDLNKVSPGLSADEKQWQEMKTLIQGIKLKLEELSQDPPPTEPKP